jgi:UDP-N-acetylmuramoyl-L-alanyl-D-glutamate--2,6-diaminopimelate ligase
VRHLWVNGKSNIYKQTDPVKHSDFAVTGTNGKTTISRLIAELISSQGRLCSDGDNRQWYFTKLDAFNAYHFDALQLQNALHDYAKQGAILLHLKRVHMVLNKVV